ncbi:alpha-L-fucosidase [Puteibacter caeruleilacunae]|nr:alpha-L-fucosidase [Puteibacter caeruleilacunae]
MQYIRLIILTLLTFGVISCAQVTPPQPYGAVPSEAQMQWHNMEYFSLVCYGLNSYTEEEWAYGDVDPKLFNPSDLDTDQWARVTSEAGMKGLILVAKHHDGFCLWPSKYTDYSVESTPWKNGQGDVLGDLAKSCKKYGLKLGVYLSPWDRNHAEYGRPAYVDYYYKQLEELLTEYGEVFEFWIDGANGGTGYYGGANERRNIDRKTYYGYDKIFSIVKKHQPGAVIFSDVGPGTRWVGNEQGIGGETNWNTISTHGKFPGDSDPSYSKKLTCGEEGGTSWIPAEVNTTLLWPKAWYFHTGHQPRSLANLMDLYYTSIGRGSPLNLGIAIAPSGLIREADANALLKFKEQVDREFSNNLISAAKLTASNTRGYRSTYSIKQCADNNKDTYWASEDNIQQAVIDITFDNPTTFNRLMLQEHIKLGQRITDFTLEAEINGVFEQLAKGTTVGYKRIIRFDDVKTQRARITVKTNAPCLTLSEIGIFNAPVLIDDPQVNKSNDGMVTLSCSSDAKIYYSLNETTAKDQFTQYSAPITLPKGGKLSYYAKAVDGSYATEVLSEAIGIARTDWIVKDKAMQAAIDNNPRTFAMTKANELIVDLGKEQKISGFSYLARQDGKKEGMIFEYAFYVSADGRNWKKPIVEGTFSNIENNPIKREIMLPQTMTNRYIKLVGKSDVRQCGSSSFAEIEVFSN